MLEHGDSITRHLAWVTGGRADERDALYGPALRGVDRQALSRMLVARLVPGAEPVERMMDLDRRLWLVDDVLAKADRASMRVSLELRTPFLTRELADLALALPGHERTADGGKAVLRRLLKEIAPQAAQRPKTAFRVPLAEWLRGPLRSEVRRHASEGPAVSQGLFDPQAMTSLVSDHASGQVDASATLWPFLALSCWLEATPSLHPT
jgi:asparagine synthase (glutamine-hydrolysing)